MNTRAALAVIARPRKQWGEPAALAPTLLAAGCAAAVLFQLLGVLSSFADLQASLETLRHLAATVMPRAAQVGRLLELVVLQSYARKYPH
jgi:hypothetical protein